MEVKLGEVQPILDYVNGRFHSVYNVHRDVSVDEAMIPFKRRSSLKQYMPNKPVKRGIKVWALADAKNGYISKAKVYTSKKSDRSRVKLGFKCCKRPHFSFASKVSVCVSEYNYLPESFPNTGIITSTVTISLVVWISAWT